MCVLNIRQGLPSIFFLHKEWDESIKIALKDINDRSRQIFGMHLTRVPFLCPSENIAVIKILIKPHLLSIDEAK